jgi:hypothetical protein
MPMKTVVCPSPKNKNMAMLANLFIFAGGKQEEYDNSCFGKGNQ